MNLNIPLEGIAARIEKGTLVIESKEPLRALSTATLNGGLHEARTIIDRRITHMPEMDTDVSVRKLLEDTAKDLNLPEPVVGLTTGVDVQNVEVATEQEQGTAVSALVTAGIKYPVAAGDAVLAKWRALGTVNIVLLIDGNLTEACMVDAVKTAIEAKTVAFRELDIRSHVSGELASGTIADGIVVACTGKKEIIKFAGTATVLGELIGKSLRKAIKEAIWKQEKMTHGRPLMKRLEERGINEDTLLNMAFDFGGPYEGIETREKTMQLLKETCDQILSNVNVAALVLAGFRMQEDGISGLIPNMPSSEFENLPSFFVAHRMLGMMIANYIAGMEGIVEYTRLGKGKQKTLEKFGLVSQEVICGIIAGISARVRASNVTA